jgi:hypothetical protein
MARSLGQLTTFQIDDTTIGTYLDEGYDEVVARREWPWSFVLTPETVEMVSGQGEYALDAKVKRINGVVDVVQRRDLESVGIADWVRRQERIEGTSRPMIWTFSKQTLFVHPLPATTDDLDVYYYEHPAWIGIGDGDDVPPFDPAFHTMLVDWILHRAWEQEEDFQKSDDYRGRFEARMGRMINFYNDQQGDFPKIYGQRGQRVFASNMPWLGDARIGGAG